MTRLFMRVTTGIEITWEPLFQTVCCKSAHESRNQYEITKHSIQYKLGVIEVDDRPTK